MYLYLNNDFDLEILRYQKIKRKRNSGKRTTVIRPDVLHDIIRIILISNINY